MINSVPNVEILFDFLRKQKMRKIKLIIFEILFIVILSGCSVSLAADVTPPPNLIQQEPVQMQPTTSTSIVLPMIEPDVQNGERIYQEKCMPCHGESGMGDGVQSNQLPNPVTPIGDFNIAKDAKPFDWYRVITIGNIERFMPGFTSLSDRERWDVTAYALTLSLSEDLINQGEIIFNENCIECHTTEKLPLQKASKMAEKSINDILEIVENGIEPEMHDFSELISLQDKLAVSSYVRYLGFSEKSTTSQIEEGEFVPPENEMTETNIDQSIFSIQGELTNLEIIPENIVVTLSGYDGMEMVFQMEAPVLENGTFSFENLENVSGRVYQAALVIDEIQHNSSVLHDPVIDNQGNVKLPIEIKKTSIDPSSLYAERMHVFFDFIDENTVQIVEMYVIQNPSDSVIIPKDNSSPVIKFSLPSEAQNLQFEQGTMGRDYLPLENGFGSLQTFGANTSVQILFAYELPYSKSLDLTFPLPLQVNASIFMLPANLVKFSSDQLQFSGDRDIQGMSIQTYSGGVMTAESSINVKLSGKVKESTPVIQDGNLTSILIGSVVLVLAIGFSILYFRKKLKSGNDTAEIDPDEEDLDSLLDAIIALDDAYKSGEIPENAYNNRRNELTGLIKTKQSSEELN
jgi:mono/diheme cytochrome c family protein